MLERLGVPFAVAGFETKQDGDSEVGTFRGLASTFGNVDLVNDIIEPGAFKDSLKRPGRIKMLWQHDMAQPLGTWEEIRETARGLEVKGRLVLGVQKAREAFELMKAGAVDALSIGFRVPEGGATLDDKARVRRLKKVDLMEVSIVTIPANPKARIQAVKSAFEAGDVPSRDDLFLALRSELGLSRKMAKKLLAGGYGALDPEAEAIEELAGSLARLREVVLN